MPGTAMSPTRKRAALLRTMTMRAASTPAMGSIFRIWVRSPSAGPTSVRPNESIPSPSSPSSMASRTLAGGLNAPSIASSRSMRVPQRIAASERGGADERGDASVGARPGTAERPASSRGVSEPLSRRFTR